MQNAISWFEIPTTDINRAQQFYETIFGITMRLSQSFGYRWAIDLLKWKS